MNDSIAVIAILDAKPAFVAQVEAAARACVEATRQEPGCLLYKCHKDLNIPGRFVFIEEWKSQQALAEHEQTDHFLVFADALKTLLASPLQVSILQSLDN